MNWIKIKDNPIIEREDFISHLKVLGRDICLIRNNGEYFAIQNKCPHAGAPLNTGWCKEGKIVCPYHRHEFDLRTGRGAEGQSNYVNTYPLDLREDGLYIQIDKHWWKFWL